MVEPAFWGRRMSFRFKPPLVERIIEHQKRKNKDYTWERYTKSEVVREILETGLEVLEKEAAAVKKKRGRPRKVL